MPCDYSLEAYKSQPAEVGEKYKMYRYPSGTWGLAIAGTGNEYGCPTAACLVPGSKLLVMGIGSEHGGSIGPVEEAIFIESEKMSVRQHIAGVKFSDGRVLNFQSLGNTEGNDVSITLLSLPEEKLEQLPVDLRDLIDAD